MAEGMHTGGAMSMDPFYAVKQELHAKLQYLKLNIEKHTDSTTPTSSREAEKLRKSMLRQLVEAEAQLTDLKGTVEFVEQNRAMPQVKHIDDAELTQRKAFIESAQLTLNEISGSISEMNPGNSRGKKSQSRSPKRQRPKKGYVGMQDEGLGESESPLPAQVGDVQMLLARQDEDLEELGMAVGRVGEHANVINDELADQGRMLEALDEDLETAQQNMGFVMGKMAKLLKTKSRCQIWTILLLLLVLIILVFVTVYS